MKTIFDLCEPRQDVLKGRMKDEEFAADLTSVVRPKGLRELLAAGIGRVTMAI